jgi:proline iminopeptidase
MRDGRLVVDDDGHEIYYEIHGDAPSTLIGLHGGPGADCHSLARFAELADESLQVVLYDQLGGGRSDRPEDDALWTVARFVDELDAVRSGLGLGTVHLLGRSWGGFLALQYTLDHPEAVKSLAVCNSGASVMEEMRGIARMRASLDAEVLATLIRHEAASDYEHPEYQAAVARVYAEHFRRSSPYDPATSLAELGRDVLPDLADLGRPYVVMWGPNEFVCTGSLLEWDVTHRLSEITAPTLIVAGWYDIVSVEAHRVMADRIPDNEFVIFGSARLPATPQLVQVPVEPVADPAPDIDLMRAFPPAMALAGVDDKLGLDARLGERVVELL